MRRLSWVAGAVCSVAAVGAFGLGDGSPRDRVARPPDHAAKHPHRAATHPGLASLAPAIRDPISSALGRHLAGYRISDFRATNAPQHLTATFAPRGVTILTGDGGHVQLRSTASAGAPRIDGNRAVYGRASAPITESWQNGPLGLEQSFTVRRAGAAGGRIALGIQTAGTLRPEPSGSDGVMFGSELRYGDLVATDARGSRLPARLSVHGATIAIAVDARHAAFPVTIDPIVQLAELTESGGATQDNFATAVAADGDTVVVGAPNHDAGTGEAYVFTKPASGWSGGMVESAELTAGGRSVGDEFGSSVAISGNTIVVGAPGTELPFTPGAGAAYVFVEPTGGWSGSLIQSAELTASVPMTGDTLGTSVAIDGGTIVAGAPGHAIGSTAAVGAAYLFAQPAGGWSGTLTETATLGFTGAAGNEAFGTSVAASGNTVVVGAPGKTSQQGAAFVFVKPAAGWSGALTQTSLLTASGTQAGDALGSAVAVAGNTVAVGAPNDTIGTALHQGAVYVYVEPAAGWPGAKTQDATLAPSPGAPGAGVGEAVAISGDTVAAGAGTQTDGTNPAEGGAYLFAKPAAGWSGTVAPSLTLTPSDGLAGDGFGSSIALSGSTVVAGAPFRQIGHNAGLGVGYVFGLATPVITITSPADGAHYARGAKVAAAYSCAVPGAAITACGGAVANGAPIDTTTVGAHSFAVAATSSDGISYTKTVTYSVDIPPALGRVRQSHRRWRLGRKLATIARSRAHKRKRPPVGTSFSFKLSEAAQVTLTFSTIGRKHKLTPRGSLTLNAHKGLDTVRFDGRLDRTHRLSPRSYKLTVVASAAGVLSKPRSLTFTIVR